MGWPSFLATPPPNGSSEVRPGPRPGIFFSVMMAGSPVFVSINKRALMMSAIENAAYAVVHATRDRARDIAERTGMNRAVLLNKVNPHNDRNLLSLVEAVAIQKACGDHRILFAEASELGYACIPLDQCAATGDMAHALAGLCTQFGEYASEIDVATSDGRVTPNEIKRLEDDLGMLIAAATRLQSIVAGSRE